MSQPASAARRRRDLWKAAFFGLAVIALIAGVAWALLGSSFLVVRVERTTGSEVPRATVLGAADIPIGTPLARIDTAAVARRVEHIRQVQAARVTLSWPDAIVIWTRRRTAVFAVRVPGGYEQADSYGVVLRRAAEFPRGLVLLKRPASRVGRLRNDPAVLAAGAVVRTLPAWLHGRVLAVRADGRADVILVLRSGIEVRWGSQARGAAKASELAILLHTKAGYYDVSDPATAVTRSAGQGRSAGR